ncbi:hypothetical protein LWF01_07065 [Saxibacter everestensis]|uniref:Uncharacterized protein n=1 Tax=Saxibacter everestensis TaxID=2909229 RepID=A0ABY8QX20_9MICO|nr:hypothetical protein LWF01_07065 [Brevibacteriaceae bacterium ZFBP1038]
MIIECNHTDNGFEPGGTGGAEHCESCLVAAVHNLPEPLLEQPAYRPDWILDAPATFDARELDALAVLSDAGLIPPYVSTIDHADEADYPSDAWPVTGASRRWNGRGQIRHAG